MRRSLVALWLPLLLTSPATAQSIGAVNFNGATALFNANPSTAGAGPMDGPGTASQGVLFYWYNSVTGSLNQEIFATYPQPNAPTIGVGVQHAVTGAGLKLSFTATNISGSALAAWVSGETLPQDGQWHHISVIWDTVGLRAVHALDGIPQAWIQGQAISPTTATGGPFIVTYAGAQWSVGAGYSGGTPYAFYNGYLAELYMHAGPSDFTTFTTGTLPRGAPTQQKVDINTGQRTDFYPLRLGPNCAIILPGQAPPLLCVRGDPVQFLFN